MKKVICMIVVLGMIGWLCAGCENKPETETGKQTKENNTKAWEPETSKQAVGDCDDHVHDHAGGDDDGDGHDHDHTDGADGDHGGHVH